MATLTPVQQSQMQALQKFWEAQQTGLPFSVQRAPGITPPEDVKPVVLGTIKVIAAYNEVMGYAKRVEFNSLKEGENREEAAELCANFPLWTVIQNGHTDLEYIMSHYMPNLETVAKLAKEHPTISDEARTTINKTMQAFDAFQTKVTSKNCTGNEDSDGTINHEFFVLRDQYQKAGLLIADETAMPEQGDGEVEAVLQTMLNERKKLLDELKTEMNTQHPGTDLYSAIDQHYPGNFAQKLPCEPSRIGLGCTVGGFFAALEVGVKANLVSKGFIDQNREFLKEAYEVTTHMDTRNYYAFKEGQKTPLLDRPSPEAFFEKMFGTN